MGFFVALLAGVALGGGAVAWQASKTIRSMANRPLALKPEGEPDPPQTLAGSYCYWYCWNHGFLWLQQTCEYRCTGGPY